MTTVAAETECESCQAPLIWCLTRRERWIPLDRDPHPEGNVLIANRAPWCVVLTPAAVEYERLAGTLLHRAHFVTCPNAARHRSRR